MKRWIVIKPNGEVEDVGADRMQMISGTLTFFIDGEFSLGYSPVGWAEVSPAGYE